MGRCVGDAVAILIGASLIVSNRRWAVLQIGAQNRRGGFRMGPRAVTASRLVSVVVGAGLLVTVVLRFLGVGRW